MTDLAQPNRIVVLPGTLVNQIAAGEVIERPASVVKELVENSIDAGATLIEIDIEAGGTRSILVRDNGAGIHPEDINLAILRHATSKLKTREDLDAIVSLGFRGEALSSIASVADFSLTTRTVSMPHGYRLHVKLANDRHEYQPAAHPPGTTIEVCNLFYNVPARKKFLRSERTEFLHILELVRNLVMSRVDITIQLRHNGKPVLICPLVESDFRARIQSVMGSSFFPKARSVDTQIGAMRLFGWLGDAQSARSQSDRQYLYLNNRMIRDRHLTHAIRVATVAEIPVSRYPAYILYLQLDPTQVDVNVHPTKQEVRFRQPRDVHDFVLATLRESVEHTTIGQYSSGSSMVTNQTGQSSVNSLTVQDKSSIYTSSGGKVTSLAVNNEPFGIPLAVLAGGFVLSMLNGELRIIDFNKLQSIVLSHELRQDYKNDAVTVRPLLVPLSYTLSEGELQILGSVMDVLAILGVQMDISGPRSIIIRTLPSLLPELDISGLLSELLKVLTASHLTPEQLPDRLMSLLVKHAISIDMSRYTLQQVKEQLQRLTTSGLPILEKNHADLWRTISVTQLQSWLNDNS